MRSLIHMVLWDPPHPNLEIPSHSVDIQIAQGSPLQTSFSISRWCLKCREGNWPFCCNKRLCKLSFRSRHLYISWVYVSVAMLYLAILVILVPFECECIYKVHFNAYHEHTLVYHSNNVVKSHSFNYLLVLAGSNRREDFTYVTIPTFNFYSFAQIWRPTKIPVDIVVLLKGQIWTMRLNPNNFM